MNGQEKAKNGNDSKSNISSFNIEDAQLVSPALIKEIPPPNGERLISNYKIIEASNSEEEEEQKLENSF